MVKIRRPTQAGAFYEGDAEGLRAQISNCFLHRFGPGKLPQVRDGKLRSVVGLVCPHAGYVYSGPVAANAYFELAADGKPDTVFVLGPNHTGYGSGLAVVNEGFWRTPLGDVEVDGEAADELVREARIVDVDEVAHRFEHSVEVQLPFLQFLYGNSFKFVPVCFGLQDLDSAVEVGRALVEVMGGRNAVVVASSDMTHYEPQKVAARKDLDALRAVEALDVDRFYSILEAENVTACGYGPITAVMTVAKGLLVKEGQLLRYQTSGDITGDHSSVVGYAAVCFRK
jgi:AmmeMemoRadiSam system protein B